MLKTIFDKVNKKNKTACRFLMNSIIKLIINNPNRIAGKNIVIGFSETRDAG